MVTLSGEGMQCRGTVKNNSRSNQQKRNFAGAAHFFCTFVCSCFARLQCDTSRNFLVTYFVEEMLYMFSFTFFHCCSFSPCIIGGRQHFSFCHRHYKFFVFFFISVALFLTDLRWPAAHFLFFFVFLLLYIPNLWT